MAVVIHGDQQSNGTARVEIDSLSDDIDLPARAATCPYNPIVRNHDLMAEGPDHPGRSTAGVSELLVLALVPMETMALRMRAGGPVEAC